MAKTVKGRVGWEVTKKLLKAVPFIGTVVIIGLAGYEIKKKGLLRGAVHVGLDATPVVGTAKNVVEIFTGDWIPDKAPKTPPPQPAPQLSENSPQKHPSRPEPQR
jgi:hypothetical protein